MAVEGTLELFKLPEILQLIAQQKKTGILTVQGRQDIIAVTFLNGQIVAADALNQTVEEGLAQILVGERLLAAADFTRAAAEHETAGGRLFDLLVERGYISRPDLLRGLRLQTFRLLRQLLGWDKGDFKFYSGDEVPFEDGFLPISVEELLGQAAAPERPAPVSLRPVPVETPAPLSPTTPPAQVAEPVPSPAQVRPALRVVRREGEPPAPVRPVPGLGMEGEREPAGPFRQMKVQAPAAGRRSFLPNALAAALALLLGAVLLTRPEALVLPFPWQARERADLAQDQRVSLYLKIDRAAKTYFLLEGHFPPNLAQLQKAGLLAGGDLSDPQGHAFRYTVTEESYSLQPLQGDKPVPGAETSEAITGNFFLDPELLTVPTESTAPPLVLLD
jgi:Domain of unknown function (DUF4388)